MKKIFIFLAISTLGFIACNNGDAQDGTNASSGEQHPTTIQADTTTKANDAAAIKL